MDPRPRRGPRPARGWDGSIVTQRDSVSSEAFLMRKVSARTRGTLSGTWVGEKEVSVE